MSPDSMPINSLRDDEECDSDWETPQQQFDIALAKKQAEIDKKDIRIKEQSRFIQDLYVGKQMTPDDWEKINNPKKTYGKA